jgi:hypothetical protein
LQFYGEVFAYIFHDPYGKIIFANYRRSEWTSSFLIWRKYLEGYYITSEKDEYKHRI